ncbi:MAG TPA: hypothetical protein VI385_10155 [Flavisolibacter sp.]
MAIKIPIVIIVAFLYLTTVFATCRRDCNRIDYSFEMPVKAYPNLESIRVGDTIWIEISEPVSLKDLNTNRSVNYSGVVNLGTNIGFQEIIGTTPQIINAANDFSLKIINGVEAPTSNSDLFREYLFTERNGAFLFKLEVIPKRLGTFRINLGSAANVYTVNDKCSKASFVFNFENTNQHFYLYPNGGSTQSGGGTYYFKVKS